MIFIAGEILARVLLNRLIPTITQEKKQQQQTNKQQQQNHARMPVWVHVQQRGDRHDLRAEADSEEMQNMGLEAAFVDLTNAFDTLAAMDCGKSWRALAIPPPPFLTILCQLHESQKG